MDVGIPPMHLHMGQPDSIGWVEQSLEIVCAREQRKPLRHVRHQTSAYAHISAASLNEATPAITCFHKCPTNRSAEARTMRHVVRRPRME
jgi:hypothetical protein